jgi:hypothetical protein
MELRSARFAASPCVQRLLTYLATDRYQVYVPCVVGGERRAPLCWVYACTYGFRYMCEGVTHVWIRFYGVHVTPVALPLWITTCFGILWLFLFLLGQSMGQSMEHQLQLCSSVHAVLCSSLPARRLSGIRIRCCFSSSVHCVSAASMQHTMVSADCWVTADSRQVLLAMSV